MRIRKVRAPNSFSNLHAWKCSVFTKCSILEVCVKYTLQNVKINHFIEKIFGHVKKM